MESVKDVILGSKKRSFRQIADEETDAKRFQEKQDKTINMKVQQDIEKVGEDYLILADKVFNSDNTLVKIREYLELFNCSPEMRSPDHGIRLLEIHSKLSPNLVGLFNLLNSVANEQPYDESTARVVWDTCAQMYESKKSLHGNLLSLLLTKKKYHQKFIQEGSILLQKNGTPIKTKLMTTIPKTEEFDNIDSYLL